MNRKQRVEKLKAAIFSDDWEVVKNACDKLFNLGGRFNKTGRRKNRQFLIGLLNQENPKVRNMVAMTFRDYRYNSAVIPLLKAITKPENTKRRGTLVYALERLNCEQHFSELFSILFGAAGNWEVQASAFSILDEQISEFTREDLRAIAAGWDAVKDEWNRMNGIDENNIREIAYDRRLIQHLVDGYLSYL